MELQVKRAYKNSSFLSQKKQYKNWQGLHEIFFNTNVQEVPQFPILKSTPSYFPESYSESFF